MSAGIGGFGLWWLTCGVIAAGMRINRQRWTTLPDALSIGFVLGPIALALVLAAILRRWAQ